MIYIGKIILFLISPVFIIAVFLIKFLWKSWRVYRYSRKFIYNVDMVFYYAFLESKEPPNPPGSQ